jgi:hypothetical protein
VDRARDSPSATGIYRKRANESLASAAAKVSELAGHSTSVRRLAAGVAVGKAVCGSDGSDERQKWRPCQDGEKNGR